MDLKFLTLNDPLKQVITILMTEMISVKPPIIEELSAIILVAFQDDGFAKMPLRIS